MKRFLQDDRESLVRRAALLRISAAALAQNMKSGSFRSLYKGQGIEFNGVREYFLGDDVRSIDWNVTARMDRPFVKTFEEERELPVFFVIDRSLSMSTGSKGKTRLEQACEAAALLVLASEHISSPVGVVFFDGRIEFSCAPQSGRTHIMTLLSKLEELPDGAAPGSALPLALSGAFKLLRKRSLVFVLSDFRCAGWERELALLGSKHDLIAVRIIDPMDTRLPDLGTLDFIDSESGMRLSLPTSSSVLQGEWRDDSNFRKEVWKKYCLIHSCVPLVMSCEDDPLKVLLQFFEKKERPRL